MRINDLTTEYAFEDIIEVVEGAGEHLDTIMMTKVLTPADVLFADKLLKQLGGQVPFAPVNDVRDVFADPHFAARDMVVRVPHPGLERDTAIAGVAIKMSDTPGKVRHRAPLLGEHTDDTLKSIGCTAADIACLRSHKIVA